MAARWSPSHSKGCVWDIYSKQGSKVSAGGFGFVTRAATKDGTSVAIKSVPKLPDTVKSKRRRNAQRLQEEVALMQRVQHKAHVVNLRETFEDENFVYMVMELCQGGELAGFILEQGNHTEHQVALIMRQVLTAVSFLHSCNVCHRDLKPENLLLLYRCPISENVLKVADFGLAAECSQGLQGVVGTLPYMAPQVFSGRYDLAVDMWSCGVLMYLLMCGYPPFWAELDDKKTEMMIRRGNYSFPQQDWAMVSDGAKTLLRELLKMQPSERINAKDACKNAWVAGGASSASLSPALVRLRKFLNTMYATQVQNAEEERPKEREQSFLDKALVSLGLGFMSCCNVPVGNMEEVHLMPTDHGSAICSFAVGMRVLYHSATHRRWLPTLVIDVNDAGDVELEVKPRVWISPSEQLTLLRSMHN